MRSEMNVFLFFFGTGLVPVVWTYSVQDESDLQVDLLTGYNANVRPTDQVEIRCSLNLRNLLSLDIVEQTLAINGALIVAWTDPRLSWNMSRNGNISNVYFKSDQVWRPTLVLQNSATGIEVIGDNGNQKSIPLTVNADGRVFWLAPAYFVSFCPVDVSQFPFDKQTCEIKISGWLYTTDSVRMINIRDNIAFDLFEENGEYDVIRTYARVVRSTLHSSYVETLVYDLELRRKYSYYLLNVILPVLFMQLLGLVVFVVPAESGEKLTFSLTLLLSLTVMMTLVAEKIPTTSLQISTISIYMLGGAIISSLEVIMTVVILYFKHYHRKGVRISKRMESFVYVLDLLTCKKRNKVDRKIEEMRSDEHNGVTTVVDTESEGQVNEEKIGIPNVEREQHNKNNIQMHSSTYTSEDISAMIDKLSLIFFTVMTLLFTSAMILMII